MSTVSRTIAVNPIASCQAEQDIELPETLEVLEDGKEPTTTQCLFRILTAQDGDKRIVWDSMSIPQIHDAKILFDKLVAEGFVPHRINDKGNPEVIVEFDPALGEILMREIVFTPSKKMLVGG